MTIGLQKSCPMCTAWNFYTWCTHTDGDNSSGSFDDAYDMNCFLHTISGKAFELGSILGDGTHSLWSSGVDRQTNRSWVLPAPPQLHFCSRALSFHSTQWRLSLNSPLLCCLCGNRHLETLFTASFAQWLTCIESDICLETVATTCAIANPWSIWQCQTHQHRNQKSFLVLRSHHEAASVMISCEGCFVDITFALNHVYLAILVHAQLHETTCHNC